MKRRLFMVFVLVFMAFWGFGMTTALSNGACKKGLRTPNMTARACAIGLTGMNVFHAIGQPKKSSEGILYISAGIASWKLGNKENVRELFQTSYDRAQSDHDMVTLQSGDEMPRSLHEVIRRLHRADVPAELRTIWWRMVDSQDPEVSATIARAAHLHDARAQELGHSQ